MINDIRDAHIISSTQSVSISKFIGFYNLSFKQRSNENLALIAFLCFRLKNIMTSSETGLLKTFN